jgi:hypothetical protein
MAMRAWLLAGTFMAGIDGSRACRRLSAQSRSRGGDYIIDTSPSDPPASGVAGRKDASARSAPWP